jgi:hypothetical protein
MKSTKISAYKRPNTVLVKMGESSNFGSIHASKDFHKAV